MRCQGMLPRWVPRRRSQPIVAGIGEGRRARPHARHCIGWGRPQGGEPHFGCPSRLFSGGGRGIVVATKRGRRGAAWPLDREVIDAVQNTSTPTRTFGAPDLGVPIVMGVPSCAATCISSSWLRDRGLVAVGGPRRLLALAPQEIPAVRHAENLDFDYPMTRHGEASPVGCRPRRIGRSCNDRSNGSHA